MDALAPLGAKDERAQQGTPASTPQSETAADHEGSACREESSGEVGAAACGEDGVGRAKRGKDRNPNRGFSLSESDLMDGDTTHGSEVSGLDDNTVHGSEMSVLEAEESDAAKDANLAEDAGRSSRDRSPIRAAKEGDGDKASELIVAVATDDCSAELSTAPSATAPAASSTPPQSGATASAASASLGPGARAREEGWSDRDLLLGLTRPEDNPVLAAHDVSRSVGGVVVKRGLLLVCRNAVYFIDGFGTEPMLPKPGAPPRTSAEAAAAAAAAGRTSADPLHGVRRLEEWELGGGAGGIGGGNDDGEVFGAKIKVTLRRDNQPSFSVTGTGGPKSVGAAVTAEQAGGAAGGGGGRGGEAAEDDEILALGRVGVQRFSLDHIHAVYKRRYQLRDCGLEIFDVLGRSILVSFSTRAQQEEVLTYLLARGLPASIFSKGK